MSCSCTELATSSVLLVQRLRGTSVVLIRTSSSRLIFVSQYVWSRSSDSRASGSSIRRFRFETRVQHLVVESDQPYLAGIVPVATTTRRVNSWISLTVIIIIIIIMCQVCCRYRRAWPANPLSRQFS